MTTHRRWLEPVDTTWHDKAVCFSPDPRVWEQFYPLGEKEPVEWAYTRAEKAIDDYCMVCPVMVACGKERDAHEYEGVWGGEFSERRGIVDVQTGLLLRKFASQMDRSAKPVVRVPDWEPELFVTKKGVNQWAIPKHLLTSTGDCAPPVAV